MAKFKCFADTPIEFDPQAFGLKAGKGTITVDGLVEIANSILRDTSQAEIAPVSKKADKETNDQLDKLFKTLWDRYSDFARDYPIIFRQIVYHHEFSEKAFRVYMKLHHKPMWKNREEMLCEQGEYLVFIWRAKYRRDLSGATGDRRLNEYRKNIRKMLLDENEKFNEAAKEAEEIHEKNEAAQKKRVRDTLLEAVVSSSPI